jgi:hypothetical protein
MDDDALLKRIDRRLDLTEEHIRQGTEHIRQGNEVMRESHEIMRELRRDSIEEARAQRAALFAILDELKGRGPAAA